MLCFSTLSLSLCVSECVPVRGCLADSNCDQSFLSNRIRLAIRAEKYPFFFGQRSARRHSFRSCRTSYGRERKNATCTYFMPMYGIIIDASNCTHVQSKRKSTEKKMHQKPLPHWSGCSANVFIGDAVIAVVVHRIQCTFPLDRCVCRNLVAHPATLGSASIKTDGILAVR